MAGWLCRLQPEQLCDGPDCFEGAEAWGITGWVLCGLTPDQLALGPDRWLSQLNAAASVVLEINATVDGAVPTSHWPALLTPWLSHPRALHWHGRPLLLWRGSAKPVAPIPACVLSVQTPGAVALVGFAGVAEHVEATSRDYRRFLQLAHARRSPDGLLIPAVRALPPNTQTDWLHASAEAYAEWLQLSNATADLLSPDGSGLVLLDSWDGHQAWYQAAEAMDEDGNSPAVLPSLRRGWGTPEPCHWALLVHGFYLDCLEEMLESLVSAQDGEGSLKGLDLYVSTPVTQLPQAVLLLQRMGWKRVQVFGVENRGRDIAPFLLHLLPAAVDGGHPLFVKVHTKRSPHLTEGQRWADHLKNSLLTLEALQHGQDVLNEDPGVGLLAPAGTCVPLALHIDRNYTRVAAYQDSCQAEGCWLLDQNYIAGSMMAGRLEAIAPWIQMVDSVSDFEVECGQTDGTLAHGLERTLCLNLQGRGWSLVELEGDSRAVPAFGYRRLEDE